MPPSIDARQGKAKARDGLDNGFTSKGSPKFLDVVFKVAFLFGPRGLQIWDQFNVVIYNKKGLLFDTSF